MDKEIAWLLEGDVSIQYLTHRDLLGSNESTLSRLRPKIAAEGFGAGFLSCRNKNGHWGLHYYQPKWTSTHYTLLDLKNLGAPDTLIPCREMVTRMFNECTNEDGSMNLSKSKHPGYACVDGMVLNYASYFCKDEPRLLRLIDHLLSVQKADGGFTLDSSSENCDPHTTICVLEGFGQYRISGSQHRLRDVEISQTKAVEFLLTNRLFIDDADKRFRRLSYPYRYRYDLLRALEYFAAQKVPFDTRMGPAIEWLQGKRQRDGLWHLENQHNGNLHFSMEEVRAPSRFISLKALCILRYVDSSRQV
ncbi:MAG: hypothetical protein PHU23_12520 [Dehalococcoidales bacterium]|nr:hypothetical protein [Dehalococcoidales bacterium]